MRLEGSESRFLGNGIIAPLMVVGFCLGAHIPLSGAMILIIVVGMGIIYGVVDGLRVVGSDRPIEFSFIGTAVVLMILAAFWRGKIFPDPFIAVALMWVATYSFWWLSWRWLSHGAGWTRR